MKKSIIDVKKCRICFSKRLYRFLDLGSMPIPNGFLKEDDLAKPENKFELACLYCENCGLVQLTKVVNPEIMFRNYVYIPSTAKVMMNNFSNLVSHVNEYKKLSERHMVVDIGSNDGSLLTFFKAYGTKVLGIDPAENLAQVARMQGVPTETLLFGRKSAQKIVSKYGKCDAITATNVIAHINNLHSVLGGVSQLLKEDGIFITEFPYLLDLILKNEFDTIYHEHLSYFSLKPWVALLERYGFEIIDAKRLLIHGGSIRLIHRRKKAARNTFSKTLKYLISLEEYHGLYDKKSYDRFFQRVTNLKGDLKLLLSDLKKKRKKVAGYGAAAKGNVLTHYFDIGRETLDFIVDSTPYKQGLFTPGKHIPVYSEQKLLTERPDYALILAWNFADEIMEKQKKYKRDGGHFIIPVPKVKVI